MTKGGKRKGMVGGFHVAAGRGAQAGSPRLHDQTDFVGGMSAAVLRSKRAARGRAQMEQKPPLS
jgi:hypothetical protein